MAGEGGRQVLRPRAPSSSLLPDPVTSVRVREGSLEKGEKEGEPSSDRHLWASGQILHHLARTRSPLNRQGSFLKHFLQHSPAIPWFISLP